MSVSAVMIAYNEEELLPGCLAFLESMKQVTEVVCVVDQDSNDRTYSILERYASWSSKRVVYQVSKMEGLSKLRNKAIELATQDWLLAIDPDETFTPQLSGLLQDVVDGKLKVNAIRLPSIVMFKDRRHYVSQDKTGLDPHIHIWRRGFAEYKPDINVHELLQDVQGRNLHITYDDDILTTSDPINFQYHDVGRKHHQLLKSDKALMVKGLRWKEVNFLKESGERGLPVNEYTWLDWKHWVFREHKILDLPERHYDVTSDW